MPSATRIPSLRLTELDGSPDIQGVERIYLTNGNLSNLGGGNALLSLSGSTSGGGITAVSSLGAAGAAATAKFLTTDNHLYISDGSLWRPMDNPGWPRRDGTNDEEWESANSDPPSGWAWQTQDSWTVNVNSTRKSSVIFTRSTATGNFTTIYRSTTFTTSGKTIYGHVLALTTGGIGANAGRVGTLIRNSSNGRALIFYFEYTGSDRVSLNVMDLTNATTGSVTFTSTNNVWSLNTPWIFAIQNDGTNLKFKIAQYSGGDESDFQQVYSETLASFLTAAGGSADQYGYIMNINTGSQTLKIISDWMRVI